MDGSFPIPANEAERLAALRRYRILDTEREDTFDRIAKMAASMCGAFAGSINFVDTDRVWIKAGRELSQLPRSESFCAHTIMGDDVFVIPDITKAPAFRDNPIVAETGTRFYAAVPLITRDGYRIGTLCVVDTKPHRGSAPRPKDLACHRGQVGDERTRSPPRARRHATRPSATLS